MMAHGKARAAPGAPGAPRWVAAILERPWLWVAVRLALSSAYLIGGITKLLDFPGAIAEQEHFGMHPGALWAAVTIVIELAGPCLLFTRRLAWLGAGALGVLTAVASVLASPFWAMTGHDRFMALNTFFEHVGLIAGFAMVAMLAHLQEHA